MKVCMKTMSRTAKWALSSMPSMLWLMASTICTRSCALDSRAYVMPWYPSMAASCWIIYWRHPLEESQARRFILMKTGTPRDGKWMRMTRKNWKFGLNILLTNRRRTYVHLCAPILITEYIISLDWNRFSGSSVVAVQQTSTDSEKMQPCHSFVKERSGAVWLTGKIKPWGTLAIALGSHSQGCKAV